MLPIRIRLLLQLGLFGFLLTCTTSVHSGCLTEWGQKLNNQSVPDIESAIGIATGSGSSTIGMVLMSDRTIVRWGSGSASVVPESATNVISMAAGINHCIVAKGDGLVLSWGTGPGATNPALADVVAVTAGDQFNVALRADGTVIGWGQWYVGETTSVSGLDGLTDVKAISAGGNHLMILKSNGTVECFGADASGQSTVPDGLSGVSAISAGFNHSLVLKSNGTVEAWGSIGLPWPEPTGIMAIDAGNAHNLALRSNGTVVAWGSPPEAVAVPYNLKDVVAIAAGYNHSLALLKSCTAPVLATPTASPDSTICAGTSVTLTQSATGDSLPFTYQWLKNGTALEGATASTYLVAAPVHADAYSCIVTSSCGAWATSDALSLSVLPAPAAPDKTYSRSAGTSLKIRAVDIPSDAGFFAVGPSAQSASIAFDNDNIYYQPAVGNNNSDSFSYTLIKGGCTATGTMTINVETTGGEARNISFDSGVLIIRFHGIPDVSYKVERSATADFQTKSTVLTTNAPVGGEFIYTEENSGSSSAYFRLVH